MEAQDQPRKAGKGRLPEQVSPAHFRGRERGLE